MTQDGVNKGRRRFLYAATGTMGSIAAVGVATPFVKSWFPSERAKAIGAPISVDIGTLEPGEMRIAEWRGKPIFIVRRTAEAVARLESDEVVGRLADPDSLQSTQPEYARNTARAINPELLIIEGVCTHLGCAPQYRPNVEPQPYNENWLGGFFCPCHGSQFDLSGRVYRNMPAPTNLVVPPHRIEGNVVTIGEETA